MVWGGQESGDIQKERLTTFHSELSRGAVLAMFIESGTAVSPLVTQLYPLYD